MASSSLLQWPSPTPHTALLLATSTAIATVGVLFVARAALWPRPQKILRNPLTTVFPRASPRDLEGLVYRPDQFPGARDVDTPVSVFWSLFCCSNAVSGDKFWGALLRFAFLVVLLSTYSFTDVSCVSVWLYSRLRVRPRRRPKGPPRSRH